MWKEIKGYEGLYSVNRNGTVVSHGGKVIGANKMVTKEKVLKAHYDRYGYLCVNLYANKKMKSVKVHRLVALTFIPNPENKPQVNHKNGIKDDNYCENLEWVTSGENQKHSYDKLGRKGITNMKGICGKLNVSSKPVVQYSLRGDFIKEYESGNLASIDTGETPNNISKSCRNLGRRNPKFIWRFKND